MTAGDEGEDRNHVVLEGAVAGEKGATVRQDVVDGPQYLRVERQGSRIRTESSTDGQHWREVKPVGAGWSAGEFQVGIVAVNTSTTPHVVTFDRDSLKHQ